MKLRNWMPLTVLTAVAAMTSFATAEEAQKKDHAKAMVASTQVVGAEIRNASNEQIATVNDIVMNNKGELVYIIAGTGGFAGVLQTEHAIPVKAVKCQCTTEDGQKECYLSVSMTQEKLNQAPKLEADNYAELTNTSWIGQNNQYFSVANDQQPAAAGTLIFFSNVNDVAVKSNDGKDCGHVDDFVISTADHKAKYVVLGNGGTLSIGETYTALPFAALSLNRDQDEQWQASVSKSHSELQGIPKVTAPNYQELENADTRKLIDNAAPAAVVPR